MLQTVKSIPTNWLAFELNILRRLEFTSAALPFTGNPTLGVHLKRREVRVTANDMLQSTWTKAVAAIQNNGEKLSDDDVNIILEDVYVPRHKLKNPALRKFLIRRQTGANQTLALTSNPGTPRNSNTCSTTRCEP